MRKRHKVIVIGFHKTGTTSLETALERLGHRVHGGDRNPFKFEKKDKLLLYIKRTLKDWDAVQDMPWPIFFKELYSLYPDAKYILTIRETNAWMDSVVRHWGSIKVPLHRKIYNVPCAEGYGEKYIEIYERHNADVEEFFRDKKNFLIMKQEENFDYKTLCTFLEEPVLNEEFPHSRKNNRIRAKIKFYRDLRSIYWNKRNKW